MKKKIILVVVLLSTLTCIFAQHPDDIKGVWVNNNKDAKIEIYKSGEKYFGKIIWAKSMYESDGRTLKKDDKNPDAALRNRAVLNLNIVNGLSYDDEEWTGGTLYDPKSGKTFDCKMKRKGANLEIRAYLGTPMFGKTITWAKV